MLRWVAKLGARAGGAALLVGVLAGCGGGPTPPQGIVLITVDTLRPDHLGAYGSDVPTSPTMDALAREGTSFSTVIAPRGQTWPTLASILTSKYPVEHGIRKNGQPLREGVRTLAEVLAAEGYACGAFLSNSGQANWPGFEVLHDLRDQDRALLARARSWLRGRGGEPFFLWFHWFAPHRPFTPSPWLAERMNPGYRGPIDGSIEQMREITASEAPLPDADLDQMIALYNAEIRGFDRELGELFRILETLGLRDDTLIALTADHGEELFQRNRYFSHSASIYDSVLRLPLVFSWPGRVTAGEVRGELAAAIDVAPTILELAGVDVPAGFAGVSLAPAATGAERASPGNGGDPGRVVYSELEDRIVSARTERWRYVHNPEEYAFPMEGGETGLSFFIEAAEIYDHASDPAEMRNRRKELRDLVDDFDERVEVWMDEHAWDDASRYHRQQKIPDDVRESLEAIGYVGS